jgi:hypothetical protein
VEELNVYRLLLRKFGFTEHEFSVCGFEAQKEPRVLSIHNSRYDVIRTAESFTWRQRNNNHKSHNNSPMEKKLEEYITVVDVNNYWVIQDSEIEFLPSGDARQQDAPGSRKLLSP